MATIDLRHLPTQQDFFFDEDRLTAFVAGIGYGKTYVASDKLLAKMVRYPLARYFIGSNSFAQLKSGTMQTFFGRCRHWGFEYKDRIREKYVIVRRRVGKTLIEAKVETWTAADSELFRSLEMDFAWIDEGHVWSKMAFLTFLSRLRGGPFTKGLYGDIGQQLWITANPPHTTDHWLVDMTTKAPDESDDELASLLATDHDEERDPTAPPIKLYQASTFDNPYLPKAYIRSLLETMDPELADIELGGNFGDIGKGKILRMFSRAKHIVRPENLASLGLPAGFLEYDESAELCWSHDFNIDPLCSVLFQWKRVNAPGYQPIVMAVIDEMRIRHSLISHAVKEFQNRDDALRIARNNGLVLYGDPSGNAGNRQTGESDWVALRAGIHDLGIRITHRVPPAAPTHRNRYNATNAKLVNANGDVGVVMHPKCKWLAVDCNGMFYKPGTSDPEVKKTDDGSTITHLGDAFMYPIAYEFPMVEKRPQRSPARRTL